MAGGHWLLDYIFKFSLITMYCCRACPEVHWRRVCFLPTLKKLKFLLFNHFKSWHFEDLDMKIRLINTLRWKEKNEKRGTSIYAASSFDGPDTD